MILKQNSLALGSLAVAAACAIVFLSSLHPATGVPGGMIYLLTSWALPNIFVASLALGLAWLIPTATALRIVFALALSFVLGLNTSLPVLHDVLRYQQSVSSEVKRTVAWSTERRNDSISLKRRLWGPLLVAPFGPGVRIGSDEGCVCMYFLNAQPLYSDRVITVLSAALGKRVGVTDYAAALDPTQEQKDVHIDLTLSRLDDGWQAMIDLYDRGEKIATFTQTGIPGRALAARLGVGRDRMTASFFSNALDIFLHSNLWSSALNAIVPDYFPERELEVFFRQASGRP